MRLVLQWPKSALVLLLCIFPTCHAHTDASLEPRPTQADCGLRSLYILLRLEGLSPSLDEIQSHLPPSSSQGYSMLELREAAAALGLKLIGVQLSHGIESLDRPALLLVQGEETGHFLVVRPIGHTGKQFQIIDDGQDPLIMNAADLNGPNWTGLALVPKRTLQPGKLTGGFIVALTIGILFRKTRQRNKLNSNQYKSQPEEPGS